MTLKAHGATSFLSHRIQHYTEMRNLGFQVCAVRRKERRSVTAVLVLMADGAWAAEGLDVNILNTDFFKDFSKRGLGKTALSTRGLLTNVYQYLNSLFSEASNEVFEFPSFVPDCVCDRWCDHCSLKVPQYSRCLNCCTGSLAISCRLIRSRLEVIFAYSLEPPASSET